MIADPQAGVNHRQKLHTYFSPVPTQNSDSPPINTDTMEELFNHLHRGGEWAHYWTPNSGQYYTDKNKEQVERKISCWFPTQNRPPVPASWEDRNVYFCVHPQTTKQAENARARISTTAAINCCFAEFDVKDYGSKEIILNHLDSLPIYPSVTIDSGGGIHGYWLIEHPLMIEDHNRNCIRTVQSEWVNLVGGDPGARDLARVLRVPGTKNRKSHFAPNYPTVTIIEANFNRLFRFVDFEELTEELRRATVAKAVERVELGLRGNVTTQSTIYAFNEQNKIEDVLSAYGYEHHHGNRWNRPGGDNGSVDVKSDQNISFHHNPADVLHITKNGSTTYIDPFEAYSIFEHGGDRNAAVVAIKKQWGVFVEARTPVAPSSEHDRIVDKTTGEILQALDNQTTNGYTDGLDEDQQEEIIEDRHPLDVDIMEELDLGWVDDCTSFMHELTGSQVNFSRLTALVTVATAIQRKARVQLSFGPIYPNIYGCVIAPSTSFRKSTAIGQASKFLHAAMLDDLMIPAYGSMEGLVQQLSETPNALMLRDEIATLLSSDKVRYLKDLKQVLTQLYDCEPIKRRLRKEEIKVRSPYLNILGATTPEKFYSSTMPSDWADGFLPRWLWALPEGDPYWDAMPTMMTTDTFERMQQMVLPLMNIEKRRSKDFKLEGESLNMWSKWNIDAQKAAFAAEDENAAAISGRYATYAMKFALILASVNNSWGTITEETMQTAIYLADNYKAVAYRLLSEADNHKVTGSNIMKCFTAIKRKSLELKRGLTPREVGQYAGLRKKQRDACLEKLEEIGAVISNKVGRTKQFTPAVDELQPRKWN